MSNPKTVARPRAIFGIPKSDAVGVLARAKVMYNAILAAIASFNNLPITMAAFLALVQALDVAQQAAATRTKGLAKARNVKRDVLWTAMDTLRTYVQGLADTMTAEAGAALIESAGLLVAGIPTHAKAILQPKLTGTQGTVELVANASALIGGTKKKVTFLWQVSQDAKSWTSLPPTPLASTLVPNLAPMSTYWFRVSVTISRTTGAWSQPVSILVT